VTDDEPVAQDAGLLIDYWQGGLRLVAFDGRDVARALPQDEVTAVVVLGALLARNFADDVWPGEYRAVVHGGGGTVAVAEDDLRVLAARKMLQDLFTMEYGRVARRDLNTEELMAARCAVLAGGCLEPGSVTELQVGSTWRQSEPAAREVRRH
jgi:hypothetical protein